MEKLLSFSKFLVERAYANPKKVATTLSEWSRNLNSVGISEVYRVAKEFHELGIPYKDFKIVGSAAMAIHGCLFREMHDIDILINGKYTETILESIVGPGRFRYKASSSSSFRMGDEIIQSYGLGGSSYSIDLFIPKGNLKWDCSESLICDGFQVQPLTDNIKYKKEYSSSAILSDEARSKNEYDIEFWEFLESIK